MRYNLSFLVQNSVDLDTPVIGVSFNYRLSAFGFLCGSEALEAGIANNGFRDQRLALRWINENIGSFGGDPSKVTIWGESSGAESVSAQVLAYNGKTRPLYSFVGESMISERYTTNHLDQAVTMASFGQPSAKVASAVSSLATREA